MREFLEVFKYTFKENIRKKSFIISTVIILIVIVAAMVIPAVMSSLGSSDGNNTTTSNTTSSSEPKNILYILDKTGNYSDKLEVLQQQFIDYDVKLLSEDKIESIKTDIKEEGTTYLIVIEGKDNAIQIDYYTQQYMEGPNPDTVSKVLGGIYSTKLLKEANVSDDIISKALGDLNIKVNALGRSKLGGFILSLAVIIILFFAVYFYGYGVSMSVASEKTSRVMELLVTSVKPSRIILGKTAGMGLIGLIQLATLLAVGIVTYLLVFPDKISFNGMPIEFSGFTPVTVVLIIVYFILGYSLFALMNAVVGATVSKSEDVQSALLPMSLLSIFCFYFSYGTFAIPDSTMARVASLIPFTSPFTVPSRLMSTEVPPWEIGLSLFILLVSIFLIGTLSIKLYSFAVLHYGDRLQMKKLFQMSKAEKST